MPIRPTYPGVYIQELPSGVRTITGVATSVTAFLGYFKRGKMDKAVQIFSFTDFERLYGGLHPDSEASYAIEQFFLNGGTEAWVIRTAEAGTATAAAIVLQTSASGGTDIVTATAASPGEWGNDVRLEVDYNTTDPDTTFNLVVTELRAVGGIQQVAATEVFRNLVVDEDETNHAPTIVNDGSKLVTLALVAGGAKTGRPAQTGSVTTLWTDAQAKAMLASAASGDAMTVTLTTSTGTKVGTVKLGSAPATLTSLAATLQSGLRDKANSGFEKATVELLGSVKTKVFLRIKAGTTSANDVLTFSGSLATKLGLDDAKNCNVQQYQLGDKVAKGAQALPSSGQQEGDDGTVPDADALIGSESAKTGLYALKDVDIFNILCIPDTAKLKDTDAASVMDKAIAFCEERRAFYILDVPQKEKTRDEVDEVKAWLDENSTRRHKNAALYYPRPFIADSLDEYRLRAIAPSGVVAGLYARTDASRGVWKAPAGTEATLRGVQKLEYRLTDPENGTLNPLGINCLRTFPVYGHVCWGARTLDGADQQASEWKYIPVRRLALFLEESLYRGLKWVVFEPNDEPLWAQIRLNVGAFMHGLFRQGAFQGTTPKDAYLVKCDEETTTQSDRDAGIVNIVVGFAPLKPAEFVIITIKQLAGQVQT